MFNQGQIKITSKSSSNLSSLLLGLLVSTLVIAAISNPNQIKHKEVLKGRMTKVVQSSISKEMNNLDILLGNKGGSLFGNTLSGAMVELSLGNILSVDNYIVFSTTKLTTNGKTKIIGIGAFGNVHLFMSEDEMRNILNKEDKKPIVNKKKTKKKQSKAIKYRETPKEVYGKEEEIYAEDTIISGEGLNGIIVK